MSKSTFPLIDWVSKHSGAIASEWFKIIEWLLMAGALSTLNKASGSPLFFVLTMVSIGVIWAYVFFGCTEWFFENAVIDKATERLPILVRAVFSTVCGAAFFMLANFIGSTALEFIAFQK